jgi:hypothetical protein
MADKKIDNGAPIDWLAAINPATKRELDDWIAMAEPDDRLTSLGRYFRQHAYLHNYEHHEVVEVGTA